jgi:RNA polymerase sigma factor (sigma-70 family)
MSRVSLSPLLAAAIAHYAELNAFVRRLGSAAAADDIMQDMYLRLSARAGAAAIDDTRAYLFRTAANLTIDYQRVQGRRLLSSADVDRLLEVADDRPDPEAELMARSDLRMLVRAVDELPERQRAIFRLSRLQRMPHPDIARRFGVTTRTVENEIRRALAHCAARLKK